MDESGWTKKNNTVKLRPQDGNHYNTSFSKQNKHESNPPLTSKPTANDDKPTTYTVNLQLEPVKMGITARNNRWHQEFKGLGAFNDYFGLLTPTKNLGYALPDIWDGYFHITLAKFFTRLTLDQLEEAFEIFTPSLEGLPYIPDIVFRASNIKKSSGCYRQKGRQNISFVVLPIDNYLDTTKFYEKIQPLLEKIKEQAQSYSWNVTLINELHVTVRKYSNIAFELDKMKIQEFPLEFQCSHLEVKQTREQAVCRFNNTKTDRYRWWTGVTEINGECSGCKTRIISDNWNGFCLTCGKYESIIPIWSTDGKNIHHYHQLQLQEQVQYGDNSNTDHVSLPDILKWKADLIIENDLRFDPAVCTTGLYISDNNTHLRQNIAKDVWRTCRTAGAGWTQGVHYWSVRIVDRSAHGHIVIGIVSATFDVSLSQHVGATSDSYGFHFFNGQKSNNDAMVPFTLDLPKNGDSIGLLLDLDARTLTYFKNGQIIGTAFGQIPLSNGNTRYYPAISFLELGNWVSLIKTTQ